LYFEDIIILPFQKTTGEHQVRPIGCIVAGAKHSQLAFLNWSQIIITILAVARGWIGIYRQPLICSDLNLSWLNWIVS